MNHSAALKTDVAWVEPQAETETAPHVLVVDDVADNRDILSRRLVRRGFEVTEAVGGEDALAKISESSFDIVLLDIMMPDLNGNEVLKRIRKQYSNTELPVIMVTAKSQSENVVDSLDNGADDYITKPVDFNVAMARITNQLKKKSAAEANSRKTKNFEETAQFLNQTLDQRNEELSLESERRQISEEKLHYMAFHDSLTGLLNRQGFRDILSHAFDNMPTTNVEPALLFVDLDAFKSVNDVYGHEIGDKLLSQVADRLSELVGPDISVCRLGGDEFAIVTQFENQPVKSMLIAEQIVEQMNLPFIVEGKSLTIGASCGVARASQFDEDLDGLIKAADLAMYHAKSNGRCGAVLFENRMFEEQEERRALEIDLHHAIQNSEFEVFYQPLVNVESNEISGFEALVRWPHKTRGIMSPDAFIPLVEEMGLINELGNWVLRSACEEAIKWPSNINVAVNLSPNQFKNDSLLATLVNVLATTGLNPNRLELEITESALLDTEKRTIKTLESIQELGVRISMDDFGTGYSTLSYLQDFKFDKIKIDKCFVQGMEENVSDEAIIEAIVKLSDSIGMGTTAEGIETDSQLKCIMDRGCTEGQGYLFSRPLTSDDAGKFIESFVGIKDLSTSGLD
ncbi:MAG: EAL domain-containing protein [Hyphomicrobiales bacterium]|nr:EAL domain-containing protein [Hyphomicrobiales bacterium]